MACRVPLHTLDGAPSTEASVTLGSLGYDWERVGDPDAGPRRPFKVYLPRTTQDVVRAVTEARELGERLVVRGAGHSSNRLVTTTGGALLLTEWMDAVLAIDEKKLTCTMQGGAILAEADARLAEHGLGLPVVGYHDHVTAAGFASVGGISPASHRYGLFVDTVVELEYVDWSGRTHRCTPARKRDHFHRVLAGTGQHGVITSLTVAVVRVDKRRTVLRNARFLTADADEFVRRSGPLIRDPGDALMERGVWADLPLPGGLSVRLGQFSSYTGTPQNPLKSLWSRTAHGYQNLLGSWAGRLPAAVDDLVTYLDIGTVMLSPAYATVADAERFTDLVLGSTLGGPTRMFAVLAPAESYDVLFHQLYDLCRHERERSGAVTFISLYVRAIRSAYLSRGEPDRRHCELMLHLGVEPARMTGRVLDRLVNRIDDLAIAHDAFRSMHSMTTADPIKRQLVDPNTAYSDLDDATALNGRTARDRAGRRAGRSGNRG